MDDKISKFNKYCHWVDSIAALIGENLSNIDDIKQEGYLCLWEAIQNDKIIRYQLVYNKMWDLAKTDPFTYINIDELYTNCERYPLYTRDENDICDAITYRMEFYSLLDEVTNTTDRNSRIYRDRAFSIINGEPLSLRKLGKIYNLSGDRIGCIIRNIDRQMRRVYSNRLISTYGVIRHYLGQYL